MVEPSKEMEDTYELLLNLENYLLENLKPGAQICNVYKSAVEFLKEKNPDFFKYFVIANFGWAILWFWHRMAYFRFVTGIEFRESLLVINEKCRQVIKPNMTFVLTLGAQNFPNPSAPNAEYKSASIFLSDTILVAEQGPCEILTIQAKNRCRANSIRFRNNAEEQSRNEENVNDQGRSKRSVVLQEQTRVWTFVVKLFKLRNFLAQANQWGQAQGSSAWIGRPVEWGSKSAPRGFARNRECPTRQEIEYFLQRSREVPERFRGEWV